MPYKSLVKIFGDYDLHGSNLVLTQFANIINRDYNKFKLVKVIQSVFWE